MESDLWLVSPKLTSTNLNWQIGHVLFANYLHGIASITGVNEDIRELINIQDYIKFYGLKSNPLEKIGEKPSLDELIKLYGLGFKLIFKGLDELDESDLDKSVEIPNPAAKTKYQALMWLFKHQSCHNGQIAILKRIMTLQKV